MNKIEADAQAIMWLAFFSDRHAPLEISDYADRYVADRLKTLPGVATGDHRRRAQVRDAHLARPRAPGGARLTVRRTSRTRCERQNVEVPAGRIESHAARIHRALGDRPAHRRAVQRHDHPREPRLSGAAARHRRAELGALDERKVVRVNGNEAVGLGVVKQSTANTLDVAAP
jgi:multidrug efflux pump